MPRTTPRRQSELQNAALRDYLDACFRQRKLTLPMLERVVSDAMEMCNAADTSSEEISEALHRDQNLAGQVLRVANSPLVRPSRPIVSLREALTRLGLRQVIEIVLIASVKASIFQNKKYEHLATHLWRHAVATGCFVKDIARLLKGHSEGNFICGLFHNVGKPMVLNSLAAFEDRHTQPILSTDVLLGVSEYHVSVGGKLARSWNLPQQVEESIRYFRDYAKAPSFRTMATMVSLGSQLGAFLICTEGIPTRGDAEDIAKLPVSQDLGFTGDDIESLFQQTWHIRDIVDSML